MPSVSLADVIFWVAVVCCAVAQWFILRLAFAAPDAASVQVAGRVVPKSRRAAEIVWAVLPAVMLALVLAATWRAVHPERAPASAEPRAEHTAARGGERGPVPA